MNSEILLDTIFVDEGILGSYICGPGIIQNTYIGPFEMAFCIKEPENLKSALNKTFNVPAYWVIGLFRDFYDYIIKMDNINSETKILLLYKISQMQNNIYDSEYVFKNTNLWQPEALEINSNIEDLPLKEINYV